MDIMKKIEKGLIKPTFYCPSFNGIVEAFEIENDVIYYMDSEGLHSEYDTGQFFDCIKKAKKQQKKIDKLIKKIKIEKDEYKKTILENELENLFL